MKIKLTAFLFSFITITSAQSNFDSLLIRAKVSITMPVDNHQVDIPFLHKIPHNIASMPTDSSYQIRYWIKPLDEMFSWYNKKSKKEQKNSMHPNEFCKSLMVLAALDASNNKSQDYYVSDYLELTQKVYNADWEASTIVDTGWPQVGFKYCYIWCLHKDDTADVFVYILTNKKENFLKIVGTISPLIKFK